MKIDINLYTIIIIYLIIIHKHDNYHCYFTNQSNIKFSIMEYQIFLHDLLKVNKIYFVYLIN